MLSPGFTPARTWKKNPESAAVDGVAVGLVLKDAVAAAAAAAVMVVVREPRNQAARQQPSDWLMTVETATAHSLTLPVGRSVGGEGSINVGGRNQDVRSVSADKKPNSLAASPSCQNNHQEMNNVRPLLLLFTQRCPDG